MNNLRAILTDIGYGPILETVDGLRMRPIYRESDNHTSLCVSKLTGRWIDFGTGEKGTIQNLISKTLSLNSQKESEMYLKGISFSEDRNNSLSTFTPKNFSLDYIGTINELKSNYWPKRGISEKTLAPFCSVICNDGIMRRRYVFPIISHENNKIIGFTGRDLTFSPKRPKWKHIGNKSFWAYPLFINKQDVLNKKQIILVESIGDCLALFECGITNVIVTFGISLSKKLLVEILKLDPDKIFISLNNDVDNNNIGNNASTKMKSILSKYFDEEQLVIRLPIKKDFNEDLLENKEQLKTYFDE